MGLEVGELFCRRRIVDGERVDIERVAVTLAQQVDGFAVDRHDGIAVLAGAVGEIGVLAGLCVVTPHISGHR